MANYASQLYDSCRRLDKGRVTYNMSICAVEPVTAKRCNSFTTTHHCLLIAWSSSIVNSLYHSFLSSPGMLSTPLSSTSASLKRWGQSSFASSRSPNGFMRDLIGLGNAGFHRIAIHLKCSGNVPKAASHFNRELRKIGIVAIADDFFAITQERHLMLYWASASDPEGRSCWARSRYLINSEGVGQDTGANFEARCGASECDTTIASKLRDTRTKLFNWSLRTAASRAAQTVASSSFSFSSSISVSSFQRLS